LFQLSVKELLVGLELGGEALLCIRQVLRLKTESLLERLINISLNVVLVELALGLLVLVDSIAAVLLKALTFTIDLVHHSVIIPFTLIIVNLHLSKLVPQRAQSLNFRSQALLLLLHLGVNALNQRSQVLHRLRLRIINLLLQLRHFLNIVFHLGITHNAVLLLQLPQHFLNIARLLFQDLLGSVQNSHFCLDLVQLLLHALKLVVFDAQIGCVLAEVVLLHVLGAFLLLVLLLLLT